MRPLLAGFLLLVIGCCARTPGEAALRPEPLVYPAWFLSCGPRVGADLERARLLQKEGRQEEAKSAFLRLLYILEQLPRSEESDAIQIEVKRRLQEP